MRIKDEHCPSEIMISCGSGGFLPLDVCQLLLNGIKRVEALCKMGIKEYLYMEGPK